MPRITQVELKERIYKQMQEIKELHNFMKELREENEELKDGFTKEEASVFLEENEKLKKEKDEIIEEYECYKSTTDSTIGELQGEIEELKTGEPVI